MKLKNLLSSSILSVSMMAIAANGYAVNVKEYDEAVMQKLVVPSDEDMKKPNVRKVEELLTQLYEALHNIGETSQPNSKIRLDEYVKADSLVTDVIRSINLLGMNAILKFRNEQDKKNALELLLKIRKDIRPYLGKK